MTGPTYLTLLRGLLALISFILILIPTTGTRIAALVTFIIASITDFIDGKWARKKKLVTDLGAFLDPIADKMLTGLAFLALTYLNIVPIWVFAIILMRDFAVDGMRMMAAKKKFTIAASIYGKLKTTTQMLALTILLLNLIINYEPLTIIGNITLYLSLTLTIISGADYIIKGKKLITK